MRLDALPRDLLEALLRVPGEPKRGSVKIRTKEKCPKCGKKFQQTPLGFLCPDCKTIPRRFFIDLFWKGKRVKVYSFKDGQPLSSFELAKRAQEIITHQIERGTFNPDRWVKSELERFRVRYLVRRYIEDKRPEIKYSSLRKKEIWLRLFVERFGGEDIRDITSLNIQEFYTEVREGRSLKTVKNILTEVRAFFNWCLRLEIIDRVPQFPEVKPPEPVIKWIDRITQGKLLKVIPEEHRDIFEFLFTYGCRPSEARALAWDCVNFTERLVIFKRTFSDQKLVETPKGGKIFSLPMTEAIYRMLKRRYEGRRHPFFVFYYRDRLGRIHYYGEVMLRKIFKEACRKIGLREKLTLYQAVRHSFAMQRLAEGFTLGEISAVLRHSSPETIKHYAQYRTEQLLPVIEGKVIPFPLKKVVPGGSVPEPSPEDFGEL